MGSIIYVVELSRPLPKFMPVRPPVFLDKNSKALDSSIIGVYDELSEGCELRSPIPPITTMNYHINSTQHRFHHRLHPTQNQIKKIYPT